VLVSAVPRDAVDDAVAACGAQDKRSDGKLPAHVITYLTLALCLFGEDDYTEVAIKVTGSLDRWGCWNAAWSVPTTSAITQARKRLGRGVLPELFERVCGPVAGVPGVTAAQAALGTARGSFLRRWRLLAIDGFELDMPDSKENAAEFAERLRVKAPSLYKHVDSLADLAHRIAVLAMTELGDALRDATRGRAGHDALTAAAQAWRTFVTESPGRYTAANNARVTGTDDPFIPAGDRLLASLSAVLRGYELDPAQEVHALRMLRSTLHGFATLEVTGGFQYDTKVDDSFTWIVTLLDHGLQSIQRLDDAPTSTSARG